MTAQLHHHIRRMLFGAFFMAAFAGSAVRAEAQGYNWSGFYAGINFGYGWGSSDAVFKGLNPGWTAPYQAFWPDAARRSMNLEGPLAGVQVGYNIHRGSMLVGIEADAQYMRLRDTSDSGIIPGPFPAQPAHNTRIFDSVEAQSLFTLRLRGGFTSGAALLYVTGGLAVAQIEASRNFEVLANTDPVIGRTSSTELGWTVGAGLEYAVTEKWSFKTEYLFTQFDGIEVRANSQTFAGEFITSEVDLKAHILRVGLNYRFGN